MRRIETLKDRTKVIIKYFSHEDLSIMLEFYSNLLSEDDAYLKIDSQQPNVGDLRNGTVESANIIRIIAIHEEDMVADGALKLFHDKALRHTGELIVIVAHKFRYKGLGTVLMRELYLLAAQNNVDKFIVKLAKPQIAAQTICKKLGFHEEVPTPGLFPNQNVGTQDITIMTIKAKDFWKELEHLYLDSDWQRSK
jgi:L-amino acid N-acyltransferase YncA